MRQGEVPRAEVAPQQHAGAPGPVVRSHILLVTDVGLPGTMNGWQLADAGREQRPGLKVMFITGYADKAVSADSWAGGMEIMPKPFGLDDFTRKVAAMIRTGDPPTGVTAP